MIYFALERVVPSVVIYTSDAAPHVMASTQVGLISLLNSENLIMIKSFFFFLICFFFKKFQTTSSIELNQDTLSQTYTCTIHILFISTTEC